MMMDFTVLVLFSAAVVCLAVPSKNSPQIYMNSKILSGYSDDHTWKMERNAMDEIIEINDDKAVQPIFGTSIREGDIAVSSKTGSKSCFARTCLWSKSVDGHVYIAYEFSSEYNEVDRRTIKRGMELIESDTCVQFVPRTHESDYLDIKPISGCWSYLGMRGGGQMLSLQAPDCIDTGVVSHELMHVLGFVHEQSRIDRDKHVTIMWSNINTDYLRNFEKFRTNNLDTPYDYSSIMHFGKYAFSENGKPTIVPKRNRNVKIGQRYGPSDLDIFKINQLYKCEE